MQSNKHNNMAGVFDFELHDVDDKVKPPDSDEDDVIEIDEVSAIDIYFNLCEMKKLPSRKI